MTKQNRFLSFKQVLSFVDAVCANRTVMIEGPNGIGKTALGYALAKMPKYQKHKLVVLDCTQLQDGSIWMPSLDTEKGVSRELPNERFGVSLLNQKGINGAQPVIIFLDEIAKVKQYIKDALAPVIYEHRVGNIPLPDGSLVVCATNMAIEGLGDSIQPHLRSRLVMIKMRAPTQPEWKQWAIDSGKVIAEVIACTEAFPKMFESFVDYMEGGVHAGKDMAKENLYVFNPQIAQQAYVNPRSLHAVSDVVRLCQEHGGVDDDALMAGMVGTIGEAAAVDMLSYIKFGRELPLYPQVVAAPEKTKVPDSAVSQSVQTYQFVTQCNDRGEAEALLKYVNRMKGEMQAMFCHSIVTSSKAALFMTVPGFSELLRKHKILFSTQ